MQEDSKSSLAAAAVVGGGAVLGSSTQGSSSTSSNKGTSRAIASDFISPTKTSANKLSPIKPDVPTTKPKNPTPKNKQVDQNPQSTVKSISYYNTQRINLKPDNTKNSEENKSFTELKNQFTKKAKAICVHQPPSSMLDLEQVVYQSVKAPQAGRLRDESEEPFNHYDLIIGKPAGMIVKISLDSLGMKSFYENKTEFDKDKFLNKHSFFLSYAVNGIEEDAIKCSPNLLKGNVEYEISHKRGVEEIEMNVDEKHCEIKWSDVKNLKNNEYIYKFIPLYTHEGSLLGDTMGNSRVTILSKLKMKDSEDVFTESCQQTESFSVEMIPSQEFNVAIIDIEPSICDNNELDPRGRQAYNF